MSRHNHKWHVTFYQEITAVCTHFDCQKKLNAKTIEAKLDAQELLLNAVEKILDDQPEHIQDEYGLLDAYLIAKDTND